MPMLAWLDSVTLSSFARLVLAVLFDLTLKGAVVLALAWGVTTLLPKASAAVRHQVWSLALCCILLLPVLTFSLPVWRLSLLSDIPLLQEATAPLHRTGTTSHTSAFKALPVETSAAPEASTDVATRSSVGLVEERAMTPEPPQRLFFRVFSTLFIRARAISWPVWLFLIWMGGAFVVLFRFILGAAGVGWLAYRAAILRDPCWVRLNHDIQGQLLVRRPVRLLRSLYTAMPMTWGILRPIIILPLQAEAWSDTRRLCVLTHEMAHIKRLDCLLQILVQLVCAVNWFNPLVWIAARRMRHEREMACDDYVLCSGVRPSEYATHLLDIARTTRSTFIAPLGAVAMARPSQLEGRLRSILNTTTRRGVLSRASTLAWSAVTIALIAPLAAMQPSVQEGPSLQEMPTFEPVIVKDRKAFRWSSPIEEGKTLDIRSLHGHVQATPSRSAAVEVVALPRDDAFAGAMLVVERQGVVTICLQDPKDAATCADETSPDRLAAAVDFVAQIPAGVHFSGSTQEGNVMVVGLQSDVEAATTEGNIFVRATGTVAARAVVGDIKLRTASFGWAATGKGDIDARIGRTDWEGALPFHSRKGNVTVELPEEVNTDIDLHVEADGHLRSVIPLKQHSPQQGERFRGTLGRGGRLLAVHTGKGDITIKSRSNQPLQPFRNVEVRMRDDVRQNNDLYYHAEAETKPKAKYAVRAKPADEEKSELKPPRPLVPTMEELTEGESGRGPSPD